jgi:aminocarboxymuconate-semialdehyde decarboxylase
MHIVDSHFHWVPKRVFELLSSRRNARLGLNATKKTWERPEGGAIFNSDDIWFDLDLQFAHMDKLGHRVDLVGWVGPRITHFSDLPPDEGREVATAWNEEMAAAQRKYAGRFWGSAAIPLADTRVAIEVLDHAARLGLVGANLPTVVGNGGRIDTEELEPFYDRAEQLGMPLFVHPADAVFEPILDGYDGALHVSFGRMVAVSVAALRLVLSGIMERHPDLKVFVSHTGGALPYQSARIDKNGKGAKLPLPPSSYLKRMYTDTVTPHVAGMKFAVEYFGVDHVMYASDFPCWDPAEAIQLLHEVGLSEVDLAKILSGNARRILNLRDPSKQARQVAAEASESVSA